MSYNSWTNPSIHIKVEALDHVDYVMLGVPAHPAKGCEPRFLSPVLGPSYHLKPHLKYQRKDEEI